MNLGYLSDMHCEYSGIDFLYKLNAKTSHLDGLIIAGDLHTSSFIIDTINKIYDAFEKYIFIVLGNHDYYGSGKFVLDNLLKETYENHKHIHILNNDIFILDSIVFIGSTGWWDGSYYFDGKMPLNFQDTLTDFAKINDISENDKGIKWGKESYLFFEQALSNYVGKKIVCISHYGPTKQSVHPKFKNNRFNGCFSNDWQSLIEKFQPNFWIHGHTHETIEYTINNTQIFCNPRGYVTFNKPSANYDFSFDKKIIL